MKKFTGILICLIFILFLMDGCGKKEEETADIHITALKGPTAMGMVKMMEDMGTDAEGLSTDGSPYQFAIVSSVDEVTPKLIQGNTDIAAIPANLASVLYNNTDGQLKVLAINTLGVLYLVDMDGSIQSVNDLKGKTIYASGKGATPEYALNYILSANGIDQEGDVTIEWKQEHSECVAALANSLDGEEEHDGNVISEGAVALLPQPFVTIAQEKNAKIQIALDLTDEWDKLQIEEKKGVMITGVIVARKEFVEKNPEAVNQFLDSYKNSVEYVNSNITEAAALIEKNNIVPAAIAQKALPYCNIVYIEGKEMKEKLSGYLNILKEQNPKSIGGEVPADEFYYIR